MKEASKINLQTVQQKFKDFAEQECKESSDLYFDLSNKIAEDDYLCSLASFAKSGQPIPNIFLAGVHFLLLKEPDCELAKLYPSISNSTKTEKIPIELFESFCRRQETAIKEIIGSKIVQTNVINRCSYLMPTISEIIHHKNKATTIIDIGTSAGLNLNFDLYEYWYNDERVFGDSNVKIKCKTIDSEPRPIIPITQKLTKIGIDQNIIDPSDEDEKLWLKALIWPDHLERFKTIEEALNLLEAKDINLQQASEMQAFEGFILKIPKEQTLIIYSTHTLYQFPLKDKQDFCNMLDRVSQKRDFYFISVEATKDVQEKYHTKNAVVELTSYTQGVKIQQLLAETNGHGNWIAWK